MGRAPCCEKNGLKKGPWTPEEDQKLIDYIQKHGHGSWRTLPKNAGLARCGKSCRLRWTNYLRPDIKRGRFSFEEEETIIQLHSILGNKWSAIAARLPGRTDNEIKNYWNTHIRKRLLRMGIDPVTHSPRLDLLDLSSLLTNPTIYNQNHQFDLSRLLGIEPLVNSELLRVATNLLNNNTTQVLQQDPFQAFQHPQFQTPIQEIPTNVDQFVQLDHDQTNLWSIHSSGMQCNFSENLVPAPAANVGYDHILDQQPMPPCFVSENSNYQALVADQNNQNYLASVLSTPASSPTQLNSTSSTYNLNSSTEDEKDSYCSEFFKFHIPDLLDVSEFM